MFESKINRGKANGYAPLDGSGKVPLSKLPPIQSTIDIGSFATTGSNIFTDTQIISGSNDTSLTIGQLGYTSMGSFDLKATGSAVSLTSDMQSVVGVTDSIFPFGDSSVFINQIMGYPYSDGPMAGIGLNKSGSVDSKLWLYDYTGTSYIPGDVNIGYTSVSGVTSGSLNIANGNINVSGSIFVSGNIYANNLVTTGSNQFNGNQSISGSVSISASLVVASSVISNGTIDALNSDLIIEGGYLILTGSAAPTDLTGSAGDVKGMVVFDDNYLYHCIADFVPQTYQIIVSNGISYQTHVTIPKNQPGVPNLYSGGFSITTQDDVTYTLTGVYTVDDNWDCEIDNLNSNYSGGTQTMTLTWLDWTSNNIWKRISLNEVSIDNTSIQSEIAGIGAYTASLKSVDLVSGSLIASSSYSIVSAGARTIDVYSAGVDFESYPLFSNVIAASGVAVSGDTNLRYNSSTNILTVPTISATNYLGGIVSSSQQIKNYFTFAQTASINTFYDRQFISGGLNVFGGITGSLQGNISGNSGTTTLVLVGNSSTNQRYAIPFTTAGSNGYMNLYTDIVGGVYYNPSTNVMEVTGSLIVSASTNLTGSVTINQSRIDNGWTAYTPQWTAATSNPAINNGTIEGYYKVIGKTCFVRGNIAMGSTTTFGLGEWYVSMPFTASHADAILMTVSLLDNGTAWYNATMAGARAGFNHKAPIQYQNTGGTASDVNVTQPFTWASTDRFIWNGSYEIA